MQSIYNWASAQPSKTAVVYSGSAISYAMFAGAINATRSFMQAQKIPEGQTAIVVIRNLIDGWVATMALRSLGLDTVSVSHTSQAQTLGIKNVACVVTTLA